MIRKSQLRVAACGLFVCGFFATKEMSATTYPLKSGCTLYVNGDSANASNGNHGTDPNTDAFRTVQGAENWVEKFLSSHTTYNEPSGYTYTLNTINTGSPVTVCIVKTATPYDSDNAQKASPTTNLYLDSTDAYPNTAGEAFTLRMNVLGSATAPVTITAYDPDNPPVLNQTGFAGIQIEPNSNYIVISHLVIAGRSYLPPYGQSNSAAAMGRFANTSSPIYWPYYDGGGISVQGNPFDYTRLDYGVNPPATPGQQTTPYPVGVPNHITITYNTVYGCGGGGIGAAFADNVEISHNTVYDNAWWGINGASGISVLGGTDAEYYPLPGGQATTPTATVKSKVIDNYVFDNREYVPWSARDKITDGEGIIIDTNVNGSFAYRNKLDGQTLPNHNLQPYAALTQVSDNVIWNNGSSGIEIFESGGVYANSNSTFNNRAYPSNTPSSIVSLLNIPGGIYTRSEVAVGYLTSYVEVDDNIAFGPTVVPGHACGTSNGMSGSSQILYACYPIEGLNLATNQSGSTSIYLGANVFYPGPGVTMPALTSVIAVPVTQCCNAINGDPGYYLEQAGGAPTPASFGTPSSVMVPDFVIRNSSSGQAKSRFNQYTNMLTTDILGNPQPGPQNVVGAYSLTK